MRPVHPTPEGGSVHVGSRLRTARQRQRLTLAQVAQASGLTKGFLSRVERDETSPSVDSLRRICQVLSVPMGDLFAEPDVVEVRLEGAPLINMGGTGAVERLVSSRQESRVQVLHSTLEPGASGGAELYTVSCDVEVIHVVEGELTLHLAGTDITAQAGSTVTMQGREPHTWTSGVRGAVVLWVLAPAAWSGSS